MKIVTVDNITIECTEEGTRYACYIKEHDMYFSSKIEFGDPHIIRKARAMVKAKENFLKDFPQYK